MTAYQKPEELKDALRKLDEVVADGRHLREEIEEAIKFAHARDQPVTTDTPPLPKPRLK
jgi:hypothetical protein